MDFKNWMLLSIIVGVIGFAVFSIYSNSQPEKPQEENQPEPTIMPDENENSFEIPENWQQYEGETLNFYYPPEWEPETREPQGGTVIEDITLNIPNATDDYVFYSATPFDSVKPDDISREETWDVNGREWVEWMREAEGYVSYDFFTKDRIEESAGSFGVHVTFSEKNEELRDNLVTLIRTIEFTEEVKNPVDAVTPTESL